jgi:ubiquinone/menaquinone biosynthesis C-methylase UbiE
MLDRAGVEAGSKVLDVAAGAGGQSIAAARRVGHAGRVLATDISPAILAYAAAAAADAGLENLITLEMDGELLTVEEGSFGAVISRVGLIYLPDLQAALAGMRAALRPGGRMAAVVYSTAEANGFFAIPGHHSPARPVAAAGTRAAGPVQPWQSRRRRTSAG